MTSDLKIISASEGIFRAGRIIGEHEHPYYQLYYIKDNSRTFVVDGEKIKALPNSFFYIPPNTPHSAPEHKGGDAHHYEFKVSIDDEYMISRLKKISPIIEGDKASKIMIEYIWNNWVYNNPKNTEYCNHLMKSIFLTFFISDLYYKDDTIKVKRISSTGYNDISQKIMLYIRDNFDKGFSLKKMSKDIGYNSSYMSTVFAENVGITIIDYLNLYRVRMAISKLCFFSRDVIWVCNDIGFNSNSHFGRIFKRYTGTTPQNLKMAFSEKNRKELQHIFLQEPVLNGDICTISEALDSLKRIGSAVEESRKRAKAKKEAKAASQENADPQVADEIG